MPYIMQRRPYGPHMPMQGWTDTLKKIGGTAIDVIKGYGAAQGQAAAYAEQAKAAAAAQQPQGGGMPSWLLPVGLAAAAAGVFLLLRKS